MWDRECQMLSWKRTYIKDLNPSANIQTARYKNPGQIMYRVCAEVEIKNYYFFTELESKWGDATKPENAQITYSTSFAIGCSIFAQFEKVEKKPYCKSIVCTPSAKWPEGESNDSNLKCEHKHPVFDGLCGEADIAKFAKNSKFYNIERVEPTVIIDIWEREFQPTYGGISYIHRMNIFGKSPRRESTPRQASTNNSPLIAPNVEDKNLKFLNLCGKYYASLTCRIDSKEVPNFMSQAKPKDKQRPTPISMDEEILKHLLHKQNSYRSEEIKNAHLKDPNRDKGLDNMLPFVSSY